MVVFLTPGPRKNVTVSGFDQYALINLRGKSEFKWKITDQASSSIKLLTLEALHIRKERPAINTRDNFRRRELTLRL